MKPGKGERAVREGRNQSRLTGWAGIFCIIALAGPVFLTGCGEPNAGDYCNIDTWSNTCRDEPGGEQEYVLLYCDMMTSLVQERDCTVFCQESYGTEGGYCQEGRCTCPL